MTRTMLGMTLVALTLALGMLLALSSAPRAPGTLPDPSLDEPPSPGS